MGRGLPNRRRAARRRAGTARRGLPVIVGMTLLAAACGAEVQTGSPFHPDGWPGVSDIPAGVYDPAEAGEELPDGYRASLGRDDIAPVYVPNFLRSDEVDWPDEELVIGVDLNGEARAYPVGFLNRREIVVDMHRGIPTFVTW